MEFQTMTAGVVMSRVVMGCSDCSLQYVAELGSALGCFGEMLR